MKPQIIAAAGKLVLSVSLQTAFDERIHCFNLLYFYKASNFTNLTQY